MTPESLYYSRLNTNFPVGSLWLAVSDRGLVLLSFVREQKSFPPRAAQFKNCSWIESEERTRPYATQLSEYFAGQRQRFDLPLDLRGTAFQKRCWEALLKIPYGKTVSYGAIAKDVGSPKGFRAVGMANNRNPVAIIVPCHRVIASGGTLCGYGGGLPSKEWLLKLEGASWKAQSKAAG
jgi:methylated-DNA-[protein]-cysteine S-methyltransferase